MEEKRITELRNTLLNMEDETVNYILNKSKVIAHEGLIKSFIVNVAIKLIKETVNMK